MFDIQVNIIISIKIYINSYLYLLL